MSYSGRHNATLPQIETFSPVNLRGKIVWFGGYVYDGYCTVFWAEDGSVPWEWKHITKEYGAVCGCDCPKCQGYKNKTGKDHYSKEWRLIIKSQMVNGCMIYPITEKQKCTLPEEPVKPGSISPTQKSEPDTTTTPPSAEPRVSSEATTRAAGSTLRGLYGPQGRIFPDGYGQPRSASRSRR